MRQPNPTRLLTAFPRFNVAVIGDLMLDSYVVGSARRLSQEAPVPVVEVTESTSTPGGAANVLRNIASLQAGAFAFGVVGTDPQGQRLLEILEQQQVRVQGVIQDPSRPTTEKTRVLADRQQVVRIDRESTDSIAAPTEKKLLQALADATRDAPIHAVIVEDYAKGVVSEGLLQAIATHCRSCDIPLAIDPHPANPIHATGITVLTPNRAEALAMAGVPASPARIPVNEDRALLAAAEKIMAKWAPRYLVVTLGPGGMALFNEDRSLVHVPTLAREVFDVSGAGDTVIATFVLAILAGATPSEAMIVSNHAAGIVVGKLGTAAVDPDELAAYLDSNSESRVNEYQWR